MITCAGMASGYAPAEPLPPAMAAEATAAMTQSVAPAHRHEIYRAGGFDPEILDGLAAVLGEVRMQRLFHVTRSEFAQAHARLHAAAVAGDLAAAAIEAHALRGAAANIGAVALADAVAGFEAGLHEEKATTIALTAITAAVATADAALAQLIA